MSDSAPIRLDRYELRERIGAGGTARVYKAYDTNLDRLVAIKILYEHLAEDSAFQERFEREAKLIATFNHPHIVQVYDFNVQQRDDRAIYYMVMSYIPGPTLRQELEEATRLGRRLPVQRILPIMTHLADALGYAHAHGMVHRDVKPGNIIIRPDGSAVLTDFGIARMIRADRLTQQGATSGTPTYMSPEQASGEPGDARSDLYALGIMLYEMLNGQPPFDDDNNLSVMLKHMNSPIPSLAALEIGAIDRAQLNAFIQQALAKDPVQRFQSAKAFIGALERVFGIGTASDDDRTSVLIPIVDRGSSNVSMARADDPDARRTTLGLPIPSTPRGVGAAFGLIGLALLLVVVVMIAIMNTGFTPSASSFDSTPTEQGDPSDIIPSMTGGVSVVASMTGGSSIYFSTDFAPADPNNLRWTIVDNEMLSTTITPEGVYRIDNHVPNSAITTIVQAEGNYGSISLTMEARLEATSQRASAYGIVFRYQDEDNYNVFAVDGVGRYSIWTRKDAIWRELRDAPESWTSDEAVRPIGEDNRLSVTLLGDSISGYVNDVRVTRVIDSTFRDGGGIGVYVATDDGTASVAIDAYRVFSSVPSMTSPTEE